MTSSCESKGGVAFALEPGMQNSRGIHLSKKAGSKAVFRHKIMSGFPILVAAPHVVLYSSSWS